MHASSTGGTHGGLLAGRAADAAAGAPVPDVVAIGVAKEPGRDLAADARAAGGGVPRRCPGCRAPMLDAPVELDERWLAPGYAVPSEAGDAAIRWAARHGGWVLDRTYSGKALGGLLGRAREGRYGPGRHGRVLAHGRAAGRVRPRRRPGLSGGGLAWYRPESVCRGRRSNVCAGGSSTRRMARARCRPTPPRSASGSAA